MPRTGHETWTSGHLRLKPVNAVNVVIANYVCAMGRFSLQLSDLAVQLDHGALILHIFILSGNQSDKWLQATVASGK